MLHMVLDTWHSRSYVRQGRWAELLSQGLLLQSPRGPSALTRLTIAGRAVADMEVWVGRALETLDTVADGSIGMAYLNSFSEVCYETGSNLLTIRS